MIKLLYISMSLERSNYGGSVVSRTNLMALKEVLGSGVLEIAIVKNEEDSYKYEIKTHNSRIITAYNNLLGYAGRLSKSSLDIITEIIENEAPDIIYLDSSLLGNVAEICKRRFPSTKTITFFHNVEVDFELSRLKSGKIHYLPSLKAAYSAEKKSIKYSDLVITLHAFDSDRLFELYQRRSDYVVPICTEKQTVVNNTTFSNEGKFRLGFLGTAFFANVDAAKYISNKVAPLFYSQPDIQFIIAGNGFESYSEELSKDNVTVMGYVDSLDKFYESVDVIFSPITTGAGMKVKIAEAMSYNKKIIASQFSLIGYEKSKKCEDIISCLVLDDYIAAIKKFNELNGVKSSTIDFFNEYYSKDACKKYFEAIFTL